MSIIQAICDAARLWEDPAYSHRAEACRKTLTKDNRFSEESIAFAVNQQMSLLTEIDLLAWEDELKTKVSKIVGVINPGNIPLVELQDFLAVILSGHRYLGSVSSKSPFLFPAFLAEIRRQGGHPHATLVMQKDVLGHCQALIASGTTETISEVSSLAKGAGLALSDCWFRTHRFSLAILDGWEDEETLLMLAEDALMHEGMGCRSTAMVFAPTGTGIDGVLEAFAVHRGMFPAHEKTAKSLQMQQAYLDAIQIPNAYAEEFQFLLSKGEPDEQSPGHVRWVTYDDMSFVLDWILHHQDQIQCAYSNERLLEDHPGWEPLGTAQRPSLGWCPDGRSHQSFLAI